MVKLIAVDLDGTLLNEENRISDKNVEAIKFAQKNGFEVVVATGRAHFDAQILFKDTGIKTWIIGANGATIHQPNGELFHSVPINKDIAVDALRWLEKEKFYYEVSSNHSIYTPQIGRELLAIEMDRIKSANPDVSNEELQSAAEKQYSQTGFSFIQSYKELIEDEIDIYNILAFSFHEEKLRNGWKKFELQKDLTIVKSANHNFELEDKNASKGNALKILAENLNIEMADTAAIGDSFNDLSMLKIAGRSAAMGNADPEIKKACHEVALSNDENGVAQFIYTLLTDSK